MLQTKANLKERIVYSILSFLAAFFFTNGIIEQLCDRFSEDFSEERAELLWQLRNIDRIPVDAHHPRRDFYYTMEPWRVMQRMKNQSFYCPSTTRKDLLKLVVFVKSAVTYNDRRMAVRFTWGRVSHVENMVIHVVFVVGSASKEEQKILDTENSTYGDILQFVGIDDYRHIVYKVLAGMHWTKYNVPEDYLYATSDDDLLVDLSILPKNLRLSMRRATQSFPVQKKRTPAELLKKIPILCVYGYRDSEVPVRKWNLNRVNEKYYMDPLEYPFEFIPPFCLGGWYLMPAERAAKLYDASKTVSALPMDDVWITGLLRQEIDPKDIGAIDSSAQSNRSGYIKHLKGDTSDPLFGDADISSVVSESWKETWEKIKTKNHCLRH